MLVAETFHGFIETTQDVLLIFEGCRRGLLPRICRRLQERERKMIQSGSIFVFDQRESGIKRWTDGRVWSPSRILGNFLIYRELDKRNPGDKKMSISSASSMGSTDERRLSYSTESINSTTTAGSVDRNRDRQLVGSLSDTYKFRQDGLIKKTMSIVVNGVSQHLISYYDPRDVLDQKLRTPSSVPELASLEISPELLVKQNFRIPPMVEPTFDHTDGLSSANNGNNNNTRTGGHISPPAAADSLTGSLDRRMHPLRSMSLGSVRPEHHLATSHGVYSASYQQQPAIGHQQQQQQQQQQQHQMDTVGHDHSPTISSFVQPPLPIPTSVYNTFSTIPPSPTTMSSSPSTPILSPARASFQHQRHYSTSSASSSSLSSSIPRYDPRHYSTDYSTSPSGSERIHHFHQHQRQHQQQHQQHQHQHQHQHQQQQHQQQHPNQTNMGHIQLLPENYEQHDQMSAHHHHHQQQQQQQQQHQPANLGQLLNPVHPLQNEATQQHQQQQSNPLLQSMNLSHAPHGDGFTGYAPGYDDKDNFVVPTQDGNNGTGNSGFIPMQRYPMVNEHSSSSMDSLYAHDASSGGGLHSF